MYSFAEIYVLFVYLFERVATGAINLNYQFYRINDLSSRIINEDEPVSRRTRSRNVRTRSRNSRTWFFNIVQDNERFRELFYSLLYPLMILVVILLETHCNLHKLPLFKLEQYGPINFEEYFTPVFRGCAVLIMFINLPRSSELVIKYYYALLLAIKFAQFINVDFFKNEHLTVSLIIVGLNTYFHIKYDKKLIGLELYQLIIYYIKSIITFYYIIFYDKLIRYSFEIGAIVTNILLFCLLVYAINGEISMYLGLLDLNAIFMIAFFLIIGIDKVEWLIQHVMNFTRSLIAH